MQNATNLDPRVTIVAFCMTVMDFAANLRERTAFVTFCMTGWPG
jgi:hypothetical protein